MLRIWPRQSRGSLLSHTAESHKEYLPRMDTDAHGSKRRVLSAKSVCIRGQISVASFSVCPDADAVTSRLRRFRLCMQTATKIAAIVRRPTERHSVVIRYWPLMI